MTRPEPGASDTAARLVALGFQPVLAPMLRIETRPVRLEADDLAAVLVTSANAIAGLPAGYRGLPLLAVGNATAQRASADGFTQVESADGDATALAALVTRRFAPPAGGLLLAVGEGQGLDLQAHLGELGYRVLRRVTYAALPAPSLPEAADTLLREARPHVAMFFSAETARTFVRLVQQAGLDDKLAISEAVAIGEAASVALGTLPWRRIRVAARPTQNEMLALLR